MPYLPLTNIYHWAFEKSLKTYKIIKLGKFKKETNKQKQNKKKNKTKQNKKWKNKKHQQQTKNKHILKVWRFLPQLLLQYNLLIIMCRSSTEMHIKVNALFNCAVLWWLINMWYWRNCMGYSLQIFKICFFYDFLHLNIVRLEFSPNVGVIPQSKEKDDSPPKLIKCCFIRNKNLMC